MSLQKNQPDQPESTSSKSLLSKFTGMFSSGSSAAGSKNKPVNKVESCPAQQVAPQASCVPKNSKKKKMSGKEYFDQQQKLKKQVPEQGVKLVIFPESQKKMFAEHDNSAKIGKRASIKKKNTEEKKDLMKDSDSKLNKKDDVKNEKKENDVIQVGSDSNSISLGDFNIVDNIDIEEPGDSSSKKKVFER